MHERDHHKDDGRRGHHGLNWKAASALGGALLALLLASFLAHASIDSTQLIAEGFASALSLGDSGIPGVAEIPVPVEAPAAFTEVGLHEPKNYLLE